MKAKTRWIILFGLLFCFTVLSFTACSPKKQIHKHHIVKKKKLGKKQIAKLAATEQVKIKNKKEIILRVFAVDGKKISTELKDIALPLGRHTISCYISHYREYNAKEWVQPKKKKFFHLEFNAVKGRQYKPAYIGGTLQEAKFGVIEIFTDVNNVAQFGDHIPNIANRTDDCSGCAPYIILSLVDLEGGWNEVVGGHTTIAVQWEVTTPEPIDHIDLRLYREQSSSPYQVLIKQFTIKPEVIDGIEKIPGSISFDPRLYDQSFQGDISETIYKSYLVHASVVDKLGKGSGISCRQINLKYVPIQDPEEQPSEEESSDLLTSVFVLLDELEPLPSMGCYPDSIIDTPGGIYFDLPENTIEARYYEYERDGGTRQATTFRPYELVIDGTVGEKLYFTNNDTVPHRLISAYNPVYRETDTERNNGDNPHTIGGVSGLDFGFGSASSGSASIIGRGVIAKSKFQNDDLVSRLLSKKVLKKVKNNPDRVRFDDSIANKGQLRKRLKQVEGIEIGSILAIWQQAHGVAVAPGATVEITVPASELGDRHRVNRVWTLWDFTDNSGQVDSIGNIYDRSVSRKRIKIRVWYPEE